MRQREKKAAKMLMGMAIGAGVYALCPPAAVVLGLVAFMKGARGFAQTGDIDALREMAMGYGDVTGICSSSNSK